MVKKSIVILIIAALLALGLFIFGWSRATALPDWYQSGIADGSVAVGVSPQGLGREGAAIQIPRASGRHIGRRGRGAGFSLRHHQTAGEVPLSRVWREGREIELLQPELELLLVGRLGSVGGRAQIPALRPGRHVFLQEDEIEIGAILSLSEVPAETLDDPKWSRVRQLTRLFPSLATRDLYVAFRGQPSVRYGNLYFDPTSRLKVGKLTLPFATTVSLLLPEGDRFQDGLEIDLGRFDLEEIEVLDGSVRMVVVQRSRPPRYRGSYPRRWPVERRPRVARRCWQTRRPRQPLPPYKKNARAPSVRRSRRFR